MDENEDPHGDEDDCSPNQNLEQLACGIGCMKPECLQRFADPRVYLILFSIIGILQGAYFTYFVGVLSTLEKRYGFDSQITGVILIADNLSPALCGILVGYYGRSCHRPRLVATGMLIVIFSCLLSCLPYVIYGPAVYIAENSVTEGNNQNFCLNSSGNTECELNKHWPTTFAVPILFFANFLNGFGSMAYYTIGTPFMDDNVKKKESPLYLGVTLALRVVGPTLGFLLSSLCLKYYENPFVDPGFSSSDPRWIGAWWMGFLILAGALLISSVPVALFPRSLQSTELPSNCKLQPSVSAAQSTGLLESLRRLVQNPILVLHTISITFQINGIFGYYTFMPKYMESQYQKTASSASFFSGTISLVATVVAIFLGGMAIKRLKPKPRLLTGYIVFVEIFAVLGLISAIYFGCPSVTVHHTAEGSDCVKGCHCTLSKYTPVCDMKGATYFSPCFGGCTAYNETGKVFDNCSCVASEIGNANVFQSLRAGFCSESCQMFIPYFIVLSLSKIFAFTMRTGNLLITLRCVNDEDKTLALGAVEFVISIFATIPYPLIYGHVIDATCLVWKESCGKRENCWIYDREKFRYYLHGLSIAFISVGVLCDSGVFYYSKYLTNFYGEEVQVKNEMLQLDETDPELCR